MAEPCCGGVERHSSIFGGDVFCIGPARCPSCCLSFALSRPQVCSCAAFAATQPRPSGHPRPSTLSFSILGAVLQTPTAQACALPSSLFACRCSECKRGNGCLGAHTLHEHQQGGAFLIRLLPSWCASTVRGSLRITLGVCKIHSLARERPALRSPCARSSCCTAQ
jgi:hypothetical protein